MHFFRQTAGAVALAAAATLAVTGTASATTTTTTSPSSASAQALLTKSLAAANAQSAVHFVAVSRISNRTYTVTGDVSKTEGMQTVTLRNGRTTGHVEIRLVPGELFFRANLYGLTSYLGMPSSLAPKYVNTWISFTSASTGFSSIADSVLLPAAVSQISFSTPVTLVSDRVAGHPVSALHGMTSTLSAKGGQGPATLLVANTTSLPVSFAGQGSGASKAARGQVDYSKWGETVTVVAPAHAIPSSSIAAAAG